MMVKFSVEALVQNKAAPMMTPLHQSDITRVFSVYLEAGKIKDCGCASPPEAIFQTIEGQGTIYLGDEPHEVKAGDVIICPVGVPHRLEANRGEDFRLLVVRPLKQ